jgi:hypothetical protein
MFSRTFRVSFESDEHGYSAGILEGRDGVISCP